MVIDTSALLAILQDEPERRAFAEAIENAGSCSMSVANLLEASLVVESRFGAEGVRALDELVEKASVDLAPVDLEQLGIARRAFSLFGKGRHAAALNFGDCFAYALARSIGEPLLGKGDGFSRTDLAIVEIRKGE
ncbi:MAG: type II toxin-antitoxin system VapC family toxin [Thermoanaerobaculia bacterium]